MTCFVTVPDAYADSHIDRTAREPGAADNKSSASKTAKHGALSVSYIFLPWMITAAKMTNRSNLTEYNGTILKVPALT